MFNHGLLYHVQIQATIYMMQMFNWVFVGGSLLLHNMIDCAILQQMALFIYIVINWASSN